MSMRRWPAARQVALAASLLLTAASVGLADELLIGADYPPDASEEVKRVFEEAGFNCVRLSGGGYDWATPYHRAALADLSARGVKAFLQLSSHYPSGAYFQFRESWLVDHEGKTGQEDRQAWAISYSGKNWPQYSYASEEVRRQMEQDFARYLAALRGFDNVAGIVLHNEPGLHWLRERWFDYSPPALRAFRRWLQARYGTVERLNEAWGERYESFDAVTPPHGVPPVRNPAAWLDWRRANVAFIGEFLQWEAQLARRQWPAMPLMTNMAGPLDWWFAWRCADNFECAVSLDSVGIDIYPSGWVPRQFPGYAMDMARGVAQGRPVDVVECEVYDPRKWPGLSEQQLAALLRAEVWTYIGHGARGVLLWRLAGAPQDALTEGGFNPRVAAMRELTHLAGMLRLGDFRKPPTEVAVVVDPEVYLYYTATQEEPPYFLDKAGMGMHGAVREAGYEADVIFAEQVRRGQAEHYKVLLLAEPVMVDPTLAEALAAFVRQGGLLVAEAPFAEVDLHGNGWPALPGAGLDQVFGIKTAPRQAPADAITADGTELTAGGFQRDVQPSGATVIGRFADGRPAVTLNRYGDGCAAYVACCVSVPYCDGWGTWARPGLRALLSTLISRYSTARPAFGLTAAPATALVDASVLHDGRGNVLLILSVPPHRGAPVDGPADVRLWLGESKLPGPVGAFQLLPAQEQDGVVRWMPRRLEWTAGPSGEGVLSLGSVESCAVVLLARDVGPLLGLEAPAKARSGEPFRVTVACMNPSPRPVEGAVRLEAAGVLTEPDVAGMLSVPPGGTASASFRCTAQKAGRTRVEAVFTAGDGSSVPSVPVDVWIE